MRTVSLIAVFLMLSFSTFGQSKDKGCTKDKDCPPGKDCSKAEKDCPSGKDKDKDSKDKSSPDKGSFDKGTGEEHDHPSCDVVVCTRNGDCYPPGCLSPGEVSEISKNFSSSTSSTNKDTSAAQKAANKSGQDTSGQATAEEHGNDKGPTPTGNQKASALSSVTPGNDKASNTATRGNVPCPKHGGTKYGGGGEPICELCKIEKAIVPPNFTPTSEEEDFCDGCNEVEDSITEVCELSKVVGSIFPLTRDWQKDSQGVRDYFELSPSEFYAKYKKEHIDPSVRLESFKLTRLAFIKTKMLLCALPELIYISSVYRSKDHPIERIKKHPGTGPHCTMLAIDVRPGGLVNRARSAWCAPMRAFPNYDRQKTQMIVDAILRIDPHATVYFNDPAIKGVKWSLGHDDHIHVTWSKDMLKGAYASENPQFFLPCRE